MTDLTPYSRGASPGSARKLREQAERLRDTAERLRTALEDSDRTIGHIFQSQDKRRDVSDRLAALAKQGRNQR